MSSKSIEHNEGKEKAFPYAKLAKAQEVRTRYLNLLKEKYGEEALLVEEGKNVTKLDMHYNTNRGYIDLDFGHYSSERDADAGRKLKVAVTDVQFKIRYVWEITDNGGAVSTVATVYQNRNGKWVEKTKGILVSGEGDAKEMAVDEGVFDRVLSRMGDAATYIERMLVLEESANSL